MKKLLFLLAVVLLAAPGCKEKKQAVFTRTGDFSPYGQFEERLNGKVESIIEKAFWAVPQGETFAKGAKVTKHDFDSLGWTYDFIATYDINGDPVSCNVIDENGKTIYRWDGTKADNVLTRADYRTDDTLRIYVKIRCNDKGIPVFYESYDPVTDTLISKVEFENRNYNDTTIVKYFNAKGELSRKQIQVFINNHQTDYSSFGPDGTYRGGGFAKYNEKGFMSEMTFIDKDKKITDRNIFNYKYDDKGNWVWVLCKDPDKGTTIISERVYTYFK